MAIHTSGKYYNKVWETLTSVNAKSNDIGCKWHYLLNASTPSWRETFDDFCEDWITRCETTHRSSTDEVPKFSDLLKLHTSCNLLGTPGTLVSNSIENHIRQLEEASERSLGVLFPHVDALKKQGLLARQSDPWEKALTTKEANKRPDGCVIHCHNSETLRFVGGMIHSQLKWHGNVRKNGFQVMSEVPCWG